MSETLEHRSVGNGRADFDHGVLAALIAWRWKQHRWYFTLRERAPGAWLEAKATVRVTARPPQND